MESYYVNQAGSGIVPYAGMRFQKGRGFFGRLFTGTVFPLIKQILPYLGKKALDTGLSVANDVVNRRGNFRDALKSNLKKTAFNIADEALVKVQGMRGRGIKRRIRRGSKSVHQAKSASLPKRRKKKAGLISSDEGEDYERFL